MWEGGFTEEEVMLGQAATSDRSPNGEWGTFPSGHTSSTFVVASVLHEAYGPVVGIPLYALGTLVALLPNRRAVLVLSPAQEPAAARPLGQALAPSVTLKEGHD